MLELHYFSNGKQVFNVVIRSLHGGLLDLAIQPELIQLGLVDNDPAFFP